MKSTKTQYRVTFTYHDNLGGHIVIREGSTKWYDEIEEASESRWMKADGAKIVTREYSHED